jgi:hypothetical protein
MATRQVKFEVVAEDKTEEGINEATENIEGAGESARDSGLKFTEFNSALQAGNQIIEYAKQAYASLIQPTVDLGLATSRLSGSMGVSTEEASTMIQMLEDFGLTQEEVTSAMEMAVRKGYAPTIQGLSDLADEVVATQDPTKQSTLLFDIFGRKGQDVGLLLRKGGEGVRAAADDIKSMGLAMSQEDVDNVLAYRDSLNELGDAWAAAGMEVTRNFIPPITEALIALADLITFQQQLSDIVSSHGERMAMEGVAYEVYVRAAFDALQANGQLSQATRNLMEAQLEAGRTMDVMIQGTGFSASQLGILTREQYNNVVATKAAEQAALDEASAQAILKAEAEAAAAALAASYSVIIELSKSLQQETDSYAQKQSDLTARIADTNVKLADAVSKYGADSEQARGYQATLADLSAQVQKMEDDHTKATNTIVYNNLMQKLSVDGLTDTEFAMAQQMGVSLGIFTQATADQAVALNGLTTAVIDGKISQEDFAKAVNGGRDAIQEEWNKINAIPKQTDININTHRNETYNYQEYRTYRESRINLMQAAGGEGIVPPGFYHDNFLIGLSSGEKFRTTPASRVGAQEQGSGSGGNVYNFNAYGIQNPSQFLSWCNEKVELQGGIPQ